MTVKLLTEQLLEFLGLKEAAQGRLNAACQNATFLEITCHGSFTHSYLMALPSLFTF